ncbi:MAG: ABC transporter ATP-binding protein [Desulfobacteraceae bacterium]|jgi:branched-chain amino acid transport system ATP-binding protein
MAKKFLSLKNITKRFGGIVALNNIGFDVKKGEVVGLMGPNGAGKTTLLNIIAGAFAPDAGSINFKGKDITGSPSHMVCKMGIGRTFQIPQPFVSLSVEDNLRVASTFGRPQGIIGVREDFDEILKMAGLLERKKQITQTLPILSLKKLELARALACEPELILLDEIAAGLTDPEIPKVLETIGMIRDKGITVLIVEHVMKVMMNAVDRIVVMDKGTYLCEGTTDEVINDKQVIEAYFGAE